MHSPSFPQLFEAEVNLSTAMAHLKDENSRICNQDAELKQQQERLKMERKAVNQEKEQLDALSKRLNQKLKEVEDIEQVYLSVYLFVYTLSCLTLYRQHWLHRSMERNV